LRQIFIKGYRYEKVGVELKDLKPLSQVQASVFEEVNPEKQAKLQQALKVMDKMNLDYGKNTIRYGAMGYEKKWFMRQEFLSRKYTTRIEDIIIVKAI
jgi:hypothetical protein